MELKKLVDLVELVKLVQLVELVDYVVFGSVLHTVVRDIQRDVVALDEHVLRQIINARHEKKNYVNFSLKFTAIYMNLLCYVVLVTCYVRCSPVM